MEAAARTVSGPIWCAAAKMTWEMDRKRMQL